VDAGNALGVIRAFGGQSDAHRDVEWVRDAGGMQIAGLVTVFWLAANAGEPIRQPSGLREARRRWSALQIEERRDLARQSFLALEIPLPQTAEAQ
jgi:hypothetical protein